MIKILKQFVAIILVVPLLAVLTFAEVEQAGEESHESEVVENAAPVVTLNGEADLELLKNEKYVEQGAIATDAEDGELTESIEISGDIVDTSVIGTYTVVYSVTDSSGLSHTVERSVKVTLGDTPIITLSDYMEYTMGYGAKYFEQGYRAYDTEDGDLTDSVVIGGDVVDVYKPGTYRITYTVIDSHVNGTVAIRVCKVAENRPPDIILNGEEEMTLYVGDPYIEQGAYAFNEDASKPELTIVGNVDTSKEGTYTITYYATDPEGLIGSRTRIITVKAATNSAPTVTLNGSNLVNIQVGEEYIEQGATAWDEEDGDLTDYIRVSQDTIDTSSKGSYVIFYTATDSNNLSNYAKRVVNVVEGHVPTINLNCETEIDLLKNTEYVEAEVTAFDVEDGDLTDEIVVLGPIIDMQTLGKYKFTYEVTDSHGNQTSVDRIVNVVGGAYPYLDVIDHTQITIGYRNDYVEHGATAIDEEDGDLTESIVMTGDTVDSSKPGEYMITFTVTDSQDNTTVRYRYVTVAENKAPSITLNGNAYSALYVGDTYKELGARVFDDAEHVMHAEISGTVDTSKAGKCEITYSATDKEGNTSSVKRTVEVKEKATVEKPSTEKPASSGSSGGSKSSGGGAPVFIPPTTKVEEDVVEEPEVKIVIEEGEATIEAEVEIDKIETTFTIEKISEEVKEIIIDSEIVTVEIPVEVVQEMEEVTLEVLTDVELTETEAEIVGDAVVYDFNLYNGEEKVSEFVEPLTISVPYTLKRGEVSNFIAVFYMNDSGELKNMRGSYKEGQVTFETTHFSKYIVKSNMIEFTDTDDYRIMKLASLGIISGKGEGLYAPEAELTRAEVATMIVKTVKLEADTTYTNRFSDVPRSHWAYEYIMVAKTLGLVSGTSETTFDPNAPIKSQDAMIMISKAMSEFKGVENKATVVSFDNSDDYAAKFMSHLLDLDFIDEEFSEGSTLINRLNMGYLIYSMYFYE